MLIPLVETQDEGQFGGKAMHLGAALRAGLPVPYGWALSTSFVDAVAEGDKSAVAALSSALDSQKAPVVVRSSAVGEDSATASFAGQYLTCVNVCSADALVDAVCAVRASGQKPSVISYRERLGLTGTPRLGIVVQQLVEADVAGVLFSRNPLNGRDERVIEGAWGLGEAVVSGLVTPDRFRVSRDGQILERVPGDKDLSIQPRPGGGTHEVPVYGDQIAALCLNDSQLLQLHRLASRCEAQFGKGQDLEWAFSSGVLYLLQCRPITRVAGPSSGL